MKTVIFIVFLNFCSVFGQVNSYTAVQPLGKTFSEVVKLDKIDTSKVDWTVNKIKIFTKIDGASTEIQYNFNSSSRLMSKYYIMTLENQTPKSALKKFRVVTNRLTSKLGKPDLPEIMEGLPDTDIGKIQGLTNGKSLGVKHETDTQIVLTALYANNDAVMTISVAYYTPDEYIRTISR